LNDKGYMTICDPCCGSGVFMIAASKVVMNMGYNPQQVLKIDGTDIDIVCCQMAYIQTSLLGLSGTIHYGNSITMEMYDHYKTPMTDINYLRFLGTKPKKTDPMEIIVEKPTIQEKERINENDRQEEPKQLTIQFM
jgi:ribosomal protein L11 methylase PrmA